MSGNGMNTKETSLARQKKKKRAPGTGPHGVLLIDKPAGCTSHDVVKWARRALRQKKIGHCGTLDPEATGLLLLTVGKATRLTRFLIKAPKTYEGRIKLGIATDTYDASGEVVSTMPIDDVDEHQLRETMAGFVGTYEQIAPAYSAKKIKGKKLYELARSGEEVPEHRSQVEVLDFSLRALPKPDTVEFDLSCSSGTYARSLAHDLGARLECGGHLCALRRTTIGPFSVDDAVPGLELREPIEDLEALGSGWIAFDDIILPFPRIVVDAQQERRILNGQTVVARVDEAEEGDWIRIDNSRRQFVAVGSLVERFGQQDAAAGAVAPKIVFRG